MFEDTFKFLRPIGDHELIGVIKNVFENQNIDMQIELIKLKNTLKMGLGSINEKNMSEFLQI